MDTCCRDYEYAIKKLQEERDQLRARVAELEAPLEVFMENADEVIELLQASGLADNIVALTSDLDEATAEAEAALNRTRAQSLAAIRAQTLREFAARVVENFEINGELYQEYHRAADLALTESDRIEQEGE